MELYNIDNTKAKPIKLKPTKEELEKVAVEKYKRIGVAMVKKSMEVR